ncbi:MULTISPECIES: hypothetical protein [Paenibacillus]|uniref:Uncharacterized protein n=1 Tax=Paenibacillus polymyxa (strain SC2) TaxID=886882 RepID=E3EA63_PAEPS|nr:MULTISPECIES: hypothetical protein [Paenibacillus]ADO58355.1 hypothetical protein PPSC2_20575 [Paenibacillus polymyxa SC2]AZH31036.1 hypothetical protein EGM68_20875 [Paenibacillus sp. M-152]KAF6561084.1 hypothetical protein G9G63_21405 [Paenibacillus sp. EKM202P]KAF6565580.1 hypothetical protein G9G64_21460 [Paenibacillus sp. EKM207P]KAF6583293.1 hypothetical protein G9G57_13660 [Paenibacillus sp. EKM211P]
MDKNVWSEFLEHNWQIVQDNWLYIVIGLVLLLVILKIVRTLVKWLIVIVVIAGLLVYSGISFEQVGKVVTQAKDDAINKVQSEALNMMIKEGQNAKYTSNGDGTFTVTSSNLEVKGPFEGDKVKVWFQGMSLGEWSMSDTVKKYIESAKDLAAVQQPQSP